ncbi:MAG TPA: MFS transporter [Anaeromyxobacter sp.]|nr:MFS transporter [Anaeromyxobacter sp.]
MASPRTTLAISISSLFVVGILSGALGPFLPQLAARLGLPVDALGALFTALFLGALSMQVFGGWLNERVGLRNMVLAGVALVALGIFGITVSTTLPTLLGCALLAGAGQGTLDVSTNVLVPAVFQGRAVVAAVNLLHFAFGAGAVMSPLLTTLALETWGTPMPILWIAAALGFATLAAGFRWLLQASTGPSEGARRGKPGSLYRRPVLWFLSLLLFLGVGVEMGVGGWTTVYVERTTSLGVGAVAWLVSGYWLALTGGRLLGAVAGARLTAPVLARIAILGACAGSTTLLLGAGSVPLTILGTVVMGTSIGPIFPTVVVLGTEAFPSAPSRAVSVIIATSSLGGMLLPPLQGLLLQRVAPAASVAEVAAACLGSLALLVAIERAGRRERTASGAPSH